LTRVSNKCFDRRMKKKLPRSNKQKLTLLKTLLFFVIAGAGILATALLIQRQTFKFSRASEEVPPALVQNIAGTAPQGSTVVSGNVQPNGATLYVASVSLKPARTVTAVSGLGLEWKKTAAQCSGRGQTAVEMWTAVGTPTGEGVVTAQLDGEALNSVIAVSTFTNVDATKPVDGTFALNTVGVNGACEGGSDIAAVNADVPAGANTLVLTAVSTRANTLTSAEGFTEVMDLQFGSREGDQAGLALVSKLNKPAGTVKLAGMLSGETDWASTSIIIKGKTIIVDPTPTGSPKNEEVMTGSATNTTSVSSAAVQGGSSQFYVATIANYQNKPVTSVAGLGLTWTKAADQCGARGATGTQMWYAVGSPQNAGAVTATFGATTQVANIIVGRYSGVNQTTPFVNAHGENNYGEAGKCSGGSESSMAKLTVTPVGSSLSVVAVNGRTSAVKTIAEGYTQKSHVVNGNGGAKTQLYVFEAAHSSVTPRTLSFELSGSADWGTTGIVLQSAGGLAQGPVVTATPVPTATPANTPPPIGTATPTASPRATASPTATPRPTATPVATPLPSTPPVGTAGSSLWVSNEELRKLPASGAQWDAVYNVARSSWGSPDIAYQDSDHDVYVMAGAIVCVRTGEFCAKTRDAITSAIGTEGNTRWLAVGRNLLGYVIAADMLGMKPDGNANSQNTRVYNWLATFLTRKLPDNNTGVPEILSAFESGSNASAQEASVMAALAVYTGNKPKLEHVWNRYRLYVCDRTSPETVIDLSASKKEDWWHDSQKPCAVVPKGTWRIQNSADKRGMDGAIVNDMRRGGYYKWEPGFTPYPWVGLEGFVPTALILHRQGYDAFGISDQAVLRSFDYLWELSINTGTTDWFDGRRGDEATHIVNKAYGKSFPVQSAIGPGRTFGFTGFTHPTKDSLSK
jgi:hypothetical protein